MLLFLNFPYFRRVERSERKYKTCLCYYCIKIMRSCMYLFTTSRVKRDA